MQHKQKAQEKQMRTNDDNSLLPNAEHKRKQHSRPMIVYPSLVIHSHSIPCLLCDYTLRRAPGNQPILQQDTEDQEAMSVWPPLTATIFSQMLFHTNLADIVPDCAAHVSNNQFGKLRRVKATPAKSVVREARTLRTSLRAGNRFPISVSQFRTKH